ncbi:MAG: hypothetical protein E7155_00580 [Streptococcus equinus]|nr:hypothetical protein [Streptococcus equinus]QGX45556.1 hypothetical protein GO596_07010 [Streptococcus equinus]QGX47325.1 hypothetical protein GPA00_08405 [Streptococcus equinus]TFH46014.1 hypothetical protein E3305_03205 [Streptococcus equinus]
MFLPSKYCRYCQAFLTSVEA